jgi:phenylalanyl-tRNA synthetase beta chain
VEIDGKAAGWIGELHPRLARAFGLPRAAVVFEVDLEPLLERAVPRGLAVSRMPVVRRDMALLVDESTPVAEVLDTLIGQAPPVVVAIRLFDVYRGPGVPVGRKSLAILVLMQDTARTLTDVEIDAALASLLEVARHAFGAALRA